MRTTFALAALLAAGFVGLSQAEDKADEPRIVAPCRNSNEADGAGATCVLPPSPIKVEQLARAG